MTGQSPDVTLALGEHNPTIDAGFYQTTGLGDFVWLDVDGDGEQDEAEPGVEFVLVSLFDEDGMLVGTTMTDGNGFYEFTDLVPGTYTVEVPTSGPGSEIPSTPITLTTTLESGDYDETLDFGYSPVLGTLGDFVWEDLNADGVQDIDEPGIQGVTVELFDANTMMSLGTTTTGPTGEYLFVNLEQGDYYVVFGSPTGYDGSPANQGGDDAMDSDADVASGQSETVILGLGEDNMTVDAGFYQTAGLGDYVWLDEDGDGEQDMTENGIEGVTVSLLDDMGVVIATTMTDADGFYEFTDLVPGTYTVQVPTAGPENESPSTPITLTTTLASGDYDPTLDFGYTPVLGSLGDFVWEDLNADGIQDIDEPGIQGVQVILYDADTNTELDTVYTGPTGEYLFIGLPEGNYFVGFGSPNGYEGSPADTAGDNLSDSDANPVTGISETIVLGLGENNPTLDAGFYQFASLGDYVWLDLDGDGEQDEVEPGIEGVTLNLVDENGMVVATTITDMDGFYEFTDLVPGTYTVEAPAAGPESEAPSTPITLTTTLASGDNDPTLDFGYTPVLGSLGDFVWEDLNADGVQDIDEPGIQGVTVELFDGDGNSVGTTLTGPTGEYIFLDLPQGDYYVVFGSPTGYDGSPAGQGSDIAQDSDADPANGQTEIITLGLGEFNPTIDAGFYQTAGLGDYVWLDVDGDGEQDGAEPGLEGVTVELLDETGAVIATTMTDENGFYEFIDLIPGTYSVQVPSTGLNSELPSTPTILTTILASGDYDPVLDFGYTPVFSSLGDFVWEDLNADGIQNVDEPGIQGITVELFDGDGNSLGTTETGPTGEYLFLDLEQGDYYVVFGSPTGYEGSPAIEGTDNTVDSDADPATGQSPTYTLGLDEHNPTIDAGFYQPAGLGDYVWVDLDGDGEQDDIENGLEGVTVTLFDEVGTVVGTTVTDADGFYEFTDLVPGTYTVSVPAVGPDDEALSTSNNLTTTLASGDYDETIDYGYIPVYSSLGDFVWEDLDANGVQDPGEPGIQGVRVFLYDANTDQIVAVAETGPSGEYLFDELNDGEYYVQFGGVAGFTNTPQYAAAEAEDDSDADPTTGLTDIVTLDVGEFDPSIDAGYYQPASLGDFVWLDVDGDGEQDTSEPGIGGVTLTLLDSLGNVLETTMTDEDGFYSFSGLVPGTYTVEVPQVGPGGENASTPITLTTILQSADHDPTLDFGYEPVLGSIGDFVWEDVNADGIQDTDEPGIQGVTVELYDADTDELLATTETGPTGEYLFTELQQGDYYIVFGEVDGYTSSPSEEGGNTAEDSDADPATGQTDVITLGLGEDNHDIDAGFFQPASLGDYVWLDVDGDGEQDDAEPGLENIDVLLLQDGVIIAMTLTDENGYYIFDNLPPGDYVVEIEGPELIDATPSTPTVLATNLESGEHEPTIDFGFVPVYGSLGDFVWEDLDADGIQDAGEPGIAGVTVELYDAETGELLQTTTTGPTGEYLFLELQQDEYYVVFGAVDGYVISPNNEGGLFNDETDSDADPTTGQTPNIVLLLEEHNPTIDAGFYQPAGLGDFVWVDADGDGEQDTAEPGVEGVLVTLYNEIGQPIATTTTDENGFYEFIDLAPGIYTVEVPMTGPEGEEASTPVSLTTILDSGEYK